MTNTNSNQEGFSLYIPNINDELLLVKPLPIRLVVGSYGHNKHYDGVIDLFGLQDQAYLDIQGNKVEKYSSKRCRRTVDLVLPAGMYIRLTKYAIGVPYRRRQNAPGHGGVFFTISGMTDEVRKQLKVKKRKDCKNYGLFYMPVNFITRIHYLPATEPEVLVEEDNV